jgi:hypothetical protein
LDKNKVISLRPISSLLKTEYMEETAPSQSSSCIKVKSFSDLAPHGIKQKFTPELNHLKQQMANVWPKMAATVKPIIGEVIPTGKYQIAPGQNSRNIVF